MEINRGLRKLTDSELKRELRVRELYRRAIDGVPGNFNAENVSVKFIVEAVEDLRMDTLRQEIEPDRDYDLPSSAMIVFVKKIISHVAGISGKELDEFFSSKLSDEKLLELAKE